jgi:hypothetical protein
LSPRQKAHRKLQDIPKRFGYSIHGKKIHKVMIKVFLMRFPHGTDLCGGKMSSHKLITKASVVDFNTAVQEWIKLEHYEGVKAYLDKVVQEIL